MRKEVADMLWLGYEECSGLWEIDWQDGAGGTSMPTRKRVELLEELASSGLIEILFGPESIDFDNTTVVPGDRIHEEILKDPKLWLASETGELSVRFRTTEAGFAAYRAAVGWRD